MGLLTIIRKNKRQEKEMRILMVGLDNAGKTTIVKKIRGEDTSTVSPTLGFQIRTVQHGSSQLNIWDVGGQKSLRSYWRNYFEQTDAMIWVVDSADVWRLDDCRQELHNLLKEERLAGATLLILANKQDQSDALPGVEIEGVSSRSITDDEPFHDFLAAGLATGTVLELQAMGTRHWKVAECSAISGEGLMPAFDWLVSDVHSRIYLLK